MEHPNEAEGLLPDDHQMLRDETQPGDHELELLLQNTLPTLMEGAPGATVIKRDPYSPQVQTPGSPMPDAAPPGASDAGVSGSPRRKSSSWDKPSSSGQGQAQRSTTDACGASPETQRTSPAPPSPLGKSRSMPLPDSESDLEELERAMSVPSDVGELEMQLEDVELMIHAKARRKGKGGRTPAQDPRLDPNIDPKKAKRILANRQSAARSKLKQKLVTECLRAKLDLLSSHKSKIAKQMEELRRSCKEMETANAELAGKLTKLEETARQPAPPTKVEPAAVVPSPQMHTPRAPRSARSPRGRTPMPGTAMPPSFRTPATPASAPGSPHQPAMYRSPPPAPGPFARPYRAQPRAPTSALSGPPAPLLQSPHAGMQGPFTANQSLVPGIYHLNGTPVAHHGMQAPRPAPPAPIKRVATESLRSVASEPGPLPNDSLLSVPPEWFTSSHSLKMFADTGGAAHGATRKRPQA